MTPEALGTAALADRVAAAVRAVPAVADLHAGSFGEVATHLPGRRVLGVRLGETAEVHVAAVHGTPLPALAEAVRAVVAPLTGTPVRVVVEDVVPAGDP